MRGREDSVVLWEPQCRDSNDFIVYDSLVLHISLFCWTLMFRFRIISASHKNREDSRCVTDTQGRIFPRYSNAKFPTYTC